MLKNFSVKKYKKTLLKNVSGQKIQRNMVLTNISVKKYCYFHG